MAILSNTSGLSYGSHTLVQVECDVKLSKGCSDIYEIAYKDTLLGAAKNNGKIVCQDCAHSSNSAGTSSDKQYLDGLLSTIDTEAKAYLLGWIANDFTVVDSVKGLITIKGDESSINKLFDIVRGADRQGVSMITIESSAMVADILKHLQIENGTRADSKLPQFGSSSSSLTLSFVRGFFDAAGDASIKRVKGVAPRAVVTSSSHSMLKAIGQAVDVPYALGDDANSIEWSGLNALDFLAKLYDGSTYYNLRNYNTYMDLCVWCPTSGGAQSAGRDDDPTFVITRTSKDAVIPSKSRASDSGYDLTIIKTVKAFGPVTTLYDTGIKVRPPIGYYMDVVPRSSLSKSGYMLANSVGIIDRAYTGSIMIALVKVDPAAPDIQLPFCGFQMIPRPIVHFQVVEVTGDMFEDTGRGAGGFGSTEEKILKKQCLENNNNTVPDLKSTTTNK
ncbi:dUTP diphosphatase [Cavenderia fasciculata]|uniref:dUTP diphosphatase n=1 Tax=Cavenderia fasciculata TaxID=261658 RepID=F4Q0V6_CACFS|nr:dUTP diphosphatase [Cavenderia fasciculata]EGG18457.1 dUTP diphosphatase [Cavenderia fasciculata]|eukprot:XP_004366361.1 dUTP diphosphatase [Cavenderia fasciculata]